MAGLILIAASGRRNWTAGWALVGVYAAAFVAQAIILMPRNPDLLADRSERMRRGTKSWDRALLPFYGISTLMLLVVAGLDQRFGWSHPLPCWARRAGLGLALLGNGLVTWSMAANAFFSFSVRLWNERGQSVVTSDPYSLVHHPGYNGADLFAPGSAMSPGSAWSLLPIASAVLLLIIRTLLEDRTLKAELEGYADYAHRTQFRLLPGMW